MYNYSATKVDFSQKKVNVNNFHKINEKMLIKVLGTQSPSKNEGEMTKLVLAFIHANKIQCDIEVDKQGNVLITKGESDLYPCFVSHLDEVNSIQSNRTILRLNNCLVGINVHTGCFAGTGGDDGVGVYICLEALLRFEKIKVAFFVSEEIGCIGSGAVDMKFFDNVMFAFQADRKGDDEIIQYSNGVDLMGADFKEMIKPIMDDYSYKFANGTSTDVGKLSSRGIGVVTMNIGCGYFEPHSLDEKVCISAVENCMNIMFKIADKCIESGVKQTFVPEKKVYTNTSYRSYTGGYGSWHDGYGDEDDFYGNRVYSNKKLNEKIVKKSLTAEDTKNIKEYNNPEYWESFKVK